MDQKYSKLLQEDESLQRQKRVDVLLEQLRKETEELYKIKDKLVMEEDYDGAQVYKVRIEELERKYKEEIRKVLSPDKPQNNYRGSPQVYRRDSNSSDNLSTSSNYIFTSKLKESSSLDEVEDHLNSLMDDITKERDEERTKYSFEVILTQLPSQ